MRTRLNFLVTVLLFLCPLTALANVPLIDQHVSTLHVAPGSRMHIDLSLQDAVIQVVPGHRVIVETQIWSRTDSAQTKQHLIQTLIPKVSQDHGVVRITSPSSSKPLSLLSSSYWNFLDSHTAHDTRALVKITVPPSMAIRSQIGTGNFRFDNLGATNSLSEKDGTGNIDVQTSSKHLRLTTGTGNIVVRQSMGQDTQLESGNGNILWQGKTRSLRIHTGAGNINVHAEPLPAGARMYAQAGVGNLQVCLTGNPPLQGKMTTGIGALRMQYPTEIEGKGNTYRFNGGHGTVALHLSSGVGSVALRPCS